jgi:uncharacterized protein YjbI with pentapeptide repeats
MAEVTDGRRVVQASEILEKIQNGQDVEYDNIIVNGDLDLSRLNLPRDANEKIAIDSEIRITKSQIHGIINFESAIFREVDFSGTQFIKFANFLVAEFSRADFEGCQFCENAQFLAVTFHQYGDFKSARFYGNATFEDSFFNYAGFSKSLYMDLADFRGVTFRGSDFSNAEFNKEVWFMHAKFENEPVSFRETSFTKPENQEYACRRAKIVLEKNGDRDAAGNHFYREMDAKRKQKPWYFRYPEYVFVQVIFGYGIHPLRLWLCWMGFVGLFAILYWAGNGITNPTTTGSSTNLIIGPIIPLYWPSTGAINHTTADSSIHFLDYLWFSITVAVTPGFAGYKPTPGFYQILASIEAIFGTFMWAAFIATFARKYMR